MPFKTTAQFDAGDYNTSILGPAPAQRVYGILSQKLTYPVSTSANLVIQKIEPPSGLPNSDGSTYAIEVNGFSTNLECEILPLKNATKTFLPWFSIQAPYFVTNITTDSCFIKNAIVGQGADHGFYRDNNATQNYQGLFQNFTCNTGGDSSSRFPLDGNTSADHRFLLSMISLQWDSHQVNEESQNIWVKQLTGVLCKPAYSVDRYAVSYTQDQYMPKWQARKITGTNSSLKGFDNSDLTVAAQTTLNNATFGQGGSDFVVVTVPSFFQIMEQSNNNSGLEPFMDPNLLLSLGSQIYKELSTQMAYQYLTKTGNTTTFGSSSYVEDRLQVKRLTVGLMATCLGLLFCFGVLEVFVRPHNCISCEPESISSLAVILGSSKGVRECLARTGSAALGEISHQLSSEKFQTTINQQEHNSFALERVRQSEGAIKRPPSNSSNPKPEWWRPLPFQSWFATILIAIPICLIAILEVFQQLSDRNQGLIDVNSSDSDSRLPSTYLPALIMLCVATLYTSLDFSISIFAPFAALRRGNVTAARSITVNLIGKLPPHALFLSLRSRYFAACLTILAGFVSSFLTIVVSGLYSVETVSKLQMLSTQQADDFNFTHIDLSLDDGSAGIVTDLVQYSNTSYPQWTYNNLVLPSLSGLSVNISTPSNQSASMSLTVPAIRGSLNCSMLPSDSIKIESQGALPGCVECNDLVQMTCSTNLSYSLCGHKITNLTNASWYQTYAVPNDSSVVYVGTGTNLQWLDDSIAGDGAMVPVENSGGIDTDNAYTDNYYHGCPSFAFSLGTASAGTKTKQKNGDGQIWNSHSNISIMYCYQHLEQVLTNVTFSYPGFAINSTTPPVPIESTAHTLTNTTNNAQNWFDISTNTLINTLQDVGTSVKGRNWINPFIQALVWGKDGIPIDQLYDNGNMSTLTTAANRLYGQYIAQAISANMRTAVPQTGQTFPTYNATLSYSNQRLQQKRGPKIALQVMLAFMVVCAIGAYVIADTKRVLPHNPCSIAGTMSLLVESEMCNTRKIIPEGSEWKSNQTLKGEGVFNGWRFRMGWWNEGKGELEPRFGIDADSLRSHEPKIQHISL